MLTAEVIVIVLVEYGVSHSTGRGDWLGVLRMPLHNKLDTEVVHWHNPLSIIHSHTCTEDKGNTPLWRRVLLRGEKKSIREQS